MNVRLIDSTTENAKPSFRRWEFLFDARDALLIVQDRLRCGVIHFESATGRTRCGELGVHFLQAHSKRFNLLFLARDSRFLSLGFCDAL